MGYQIAVDGPAGAGKSTIARGLAKELKFIYIDTGAMYRAVALYFSENHIDLSDADSVASACQTIRIDITYEEGRQRLWLQGKDVSGEIRTEEISRLASSVAKNPDVRKKLGQLQRELAEKSDVVMDGRDIGTVVLPEADVKIFLTASSEVRARRRWLELEQRGTSREFAQLLRETRERDENDSRRAASPLRPAPDAVALDTTEIDFQESLARIIQIIRERAGL